MGPLTPLATNIAKVSSSDVDTCFIDRQEPSEGILKQIFKLYGQLIYSSLSILVFLCAATMSFTQQLWPGAKPYNGIREPMEAEGIYTWMVCIYIYM